VCYIIGVTCSHPEIKAKVQQLLTLQDSSFDRVRDILLEYSNTIGTDGENASASASASSASTSGETKSFKDKLVQIANEISVKTYQ